MRAGLALLSPIVLSATTVAVQESRPLDPNVVARLVEYVKSHPQSPEEYLLSTFKDHDIVFLGEWHRIRHDPQLVQRMIPLLHKAGVYCLATEFARRVDQNLIDTLLAAPEYDDRLAQLITFRSLAEWGYREYVDIYRVAWELNHTLGEADRKFRILAINNSPDWSFLKTAKDRDNGEIMRKVWHGETEEDWAKALFEEVVAHHEKALVYCGSHHAFTRYRQPIASDGRFLRFGDVRAGNHVFEKIGARAMTVFLHSPWVNAQGYDKPHVKPADGYIDAMLSQLDGSLQRVGFDLHGTPFGSLPGETTLYKFGYEKFTLETIYDGYICQGPFSAYEGVTAIPDFVNERNLAEARAQADPDSRNASPADFYKATVHAADIRRKIAGLR